MLLLEGGSGDKGRRQGIGREAFRSLSYFLGAGPTAAECLSISCEVAGFDFRHVEGRGR